LHGYLITYFLYIVSYFLSTELILCSTFLFVIDSDKCLLVFEDDFLRTDFLVYGKRDFEDWETVHFPGGLPCGSILVEPENKKWLLDFVSSGIDSETWGFVYEEPDIPISNLKVNPLGYTPVDPKDADWILENATSGIDQESWEVLREKPNFTINPEADVSSWFDPEKHLILNHLGASGDKPGENIWDILCPQPFSSPSYLSKLKFEPIPWEKLSGDTATKVSSKLLTNKARKIPVKLLTKKARKISSKLLSDTASPGSSKLLSDKASQGLIKMY